MRQHIFPGTFPLEALNNKGSAGAPRLFSYHRVPVPENERLLSGTVSAPFCMQR
jgi:hypothetical protein